MTLNKFMTLNTSPWHWINVYDIEYKFITLNKSPWHWIQFCEIEYIILWHLILYIYHFNWIMSNAQYANVKNVESRWQHESRWQLIYKRPKCCWRFQTPDVVRTWTHVVEQRTKYVSKTSYLAHSAISPAIWRSTKYKTHERINRWIKFKRHNCWSVGSHFSLVGSHITSFIIR